MYHSVGNVDKGEAGQVWGQGVYGKSLPLNFAINLTLLLKSLLKRKQNKNNFNKIFTLLFFPVDHLFQPIIYYHWFTLKLNVIRWIILRKAKQYEELLQEVQLDFFPSKLFAINFVKFFRNGKIML